MREINEIKKYIQIIEQNQYEVSESLIKLFNTNKIQLNDKIFDNKRKAKANKYYKDKFTVNTESLKAIKSQLLPKIELKLNEMDDIDEKSSAKTWYTFSQSLSHTLRMPLNLIFSYLDKLNKHEFEGVKELNRLYEEAYYANNILEIFDNLRKDYSEGLQKEQINITDITTSINKILDRIEEFCTSGQSKLIGHSRWKLLGRVKVNVKLNEERVDYFYQSNKTILNIVFDELIQNMYKYSESVKDDEISGTNPFKEGISLNKPEVFEIEIKPFKEYVDIRFRNSWQKDTYNNSMSDISVNAYAYNFGISIIKQFSFESDNDNRSKFFNYKDLSNSDKYEIKIRLRNKI